MRYVLITGASSGVGAATARRFARSGDKVILVARSADKLFALAAEIGDNAVAIPCDAADPAAVRVMAEEVIRAHGLPDIIINSAGTGAWKTVQDTTPEEAVAMMSAPYFAAYTITHAFLPAMLERHAGIIMHVNSPACVTAWPASACYTAARAALLGFHKALAQDLAGSGVKSCHVIFGRIDSEYFAENDVSESDMPWLGNLIPILTVESCAKTLMDLASRPRDYVISPFLLRPHIAVAMIFPRLAAWVLRF